MQTQQERLTAALNQVRDITSEIEEQHRDCIGCELCRDAYAIGFTVGLYADVQECVQEQQLICG